MKKLYCLVLLLLIAPTLLAETIYKGSDAQGNTIYSDTPLGNGKPIELPPLPTYTSPPLPVENTSPSPEPANEVQRYQVEILHPENQQTFTTGETNVMVELAVTPPLNAADAIRLIINGTQFGSLSQTNVFNLGRLDRGAYSLKAEVVSQSQEQKVKGQSETIIIYQQRASIHTPVK